MAGSEALLGGQGGAQQAYATAPLRPPCRVPRLVRVLLDVEPGLCLRLRSCSGNRLVKTCNAVWISVLDRLQRACDSERVQTRVLGGDSSQNRLY